MSLAEGCTGLKKTEAEARPATSCHLTYPLPAKVEACSAWSLQVSVKAELTAPCTYFCVVGWGPAGYSGIQQTETKRLAIFSMWHTEGHLVELVDKGAGSVVSGFDGEGEGLKCMHDLAWEVGETVTFTVDGRKQGDYWLCSCTVELRGVSYFLATYRRKGPRPLSSGGFHSFVEDWDRCDYAKGHEVCRRANFFNQRVCFDGECVNLDSVRFSKVEHGLDRFACKTAFGGECKEGFYLSTGGDGAKMKLCKDGTTFEFKP